MTDLVICNYNNNIKWVTQMKGIDRIFVYDKSNCKLKPLAPKEQDVRPYLENNIYSIDANSQLSGSEKVHMLSIPNIGAEHQTYLHHIITNYNDLADITIFCQGHPFDHLINQFLISKEQFLSVIVDKNYYIHSNGYIDLTGCFNCCDVEGRTVGHNDRFSLNLMPVISFVNPNYDFPDTIPYQTNGIFGALKSSILNISKDTWNVINKFLINNSDNNWCSEEVYKMERLWYFLLNGDSLPDNYLSKPPLPGLTCREV